MSSGFPGSRPHPGLRLSLHGRIPGGGTAVHLFARRRCGEIGEAGVFQGEGFSMKPRRQGRGCSIPPPRRAPPRGGGIPSIHCQEADRLVAVSTERSLRSLSCSPYTVSGAIAPHCPHPLEGAGGGRGAAGRWGWSTNTVQPETQETGAGDLPSAPPAGRFPMDTVSWDLAVSSRSHLTPPQRSCLNPEHDIRGYHHALARPPQAAAWSAAEDVSPRW